MINVINSKIKYVHNIDASILNFIQEQYWGNIYEEIANYYKNKTDACNSSLRVYLNSGLDYGIGSRTYMSDYMEI